MYQGWGSAPGGGQPAPRWRTGWIIGGAAAALVMMCACVVVVVALLVPLALTRIAARLPTPGSGSVAPAACSGAAPRDTAPADTTGQFTIQPLYAEALNYARDAQGQPTSQRIQIWAKDVLGPYPAMNDIFTSAVGGVDQWNQSLGGIDPSAFRCVVLDMQRAHVEHQALATLQAAARELPGPHTVAYLVPWNTDRFYGASGEQSLLIPFWEPDPLNRLLPRDSAQDWFYMAGALDHEYMEVARYDRLGSLDNAYLTLLDNMVTDGMADDFAAHMTGQRPDWGIDPATEAALWAKFKPSVTEYANPNQESEMLGDPANGIPNAAGYQIGDHIVADYLARHPQVTFDQLAGMDATVIYAGSGYNG